MIFGYACWPNIERARVNRGPNDARTWMAKAIVWLGLLCGLPWLLNRMVQPTGIEGLLLSIIAITAVILAVSGGAFVWSRMQRGQLR